MAFGRAAVPGTALQSCQQISFEKKENSVCILVKMSKKDKFYGIYDGNPLECLS
jgi:hypothetical protein